MVQPRADAPHRHDYHDGADPQQEFEQADQSLHERAASVGTGTDETGVQELGLDVDHDPHDRGDDDPGDGRRHQRGVNPNHAPTGTTCAATMTSSAATSELAVTTNQQV